MTMEKRKIRVERVILLVVIALLLIALIGFGIYLILPKKPVDPDKPDDPDKPVDPVTKDVITTELVSYEFYEDADKELGFDFVIAELAFSGKESVEFDLKDLETSQKIKLNSYEKYVKKLTEKKYSLESRDVVTSVKSKDNTITVRLFVPVENGEKKKIILYNRQTDQGMSIDLTQNKADLKTLKKETDGNVIDDQGKYDLKVSDSFVSTMMLKRGQEYSIPSDCSIYTFKLKVNSASEGVVIEDAVFVQTSTGEAYEALGSMYESQKLDNIIGRNLADVDESMALFFEVEDNNRDYKGVLRLKFSSDAEWKEFSTELR